MSMGKPLSVVIVLLLPDIQGHVNNVAATVWWMSKWWYLVAEAKLKSSAMMARAEAQAPDWGVVIL